MKNRLYLVCGVLLVAAVLGTVWRWWPWSPPEPVYDGKPLSYWLPRPGSARDFQPYARLFPGPTNLLNDSRAVPILIRALNRDTWVGASWYRRWLWPRLSPRIQSHLPPPPPGNWVARHNAAVILGNMGPKAKPAVPALVRALDEDEQDEVRDSVIMAFINLKKWDDDGSISRDYVPALIRCLKQANNWEIRDLAVSALGHLPKMNSAAIAALAEAAVKDKHYIVRGHAMNCLRGVEQAYATVMPALFAALHDPNFEVRDQAAYYIGRMGFTNDATIAALTGAQSDRDLTVRFAATNALWHVDPEAAAKAGVKPPPR